MARDPLSVRREGLIGQARDLVVWMETWPDAAAWLDRVGGAGLLSRLRELADAADAAISRSERHNLHSPYLTANVDLDAARLWAREVRFFLRPHGQKPAARELRDLVSGGKHRVAGTAEELRTAVARLRDYAPVLGDGLLDLAASGQVLLDSLGRLQAEHGIWEDQGIDLAADATAQTNALRDTLRAIRTQWRLVRIRSSDQMPELPMHLAKSLTARRASTGIAPGEDVEDGERAEPG